VKLPSGAKKVIPSANRAMVGIVAGGGRIDKPMLKAGRAYHKYKAKRNCWPKVGTSSSLIIFLLCPLLTSELSTCDFSANKRGKIVLRGFQTLFCCRKNRLFHPTHRSRFNMKIVTFLCSVIFLCRYGRQCALPLTVHELICLEALFRIRNFGLLDSNPLYFVTDPNPSWSSGYCVIKLELQSSVAGPDHFDPDPNPAFHLDTDPYSDPVVQIYTDPVPTV
jgi:hypothetical protein